MFFLLISNSSFKADFIGRNRCFVVTFSLCPSFSFIFLFDLLNYQHTFHFCCCIFFGLLRNAITYIQQVQGQ